ncbi:MAG: hypothetical protein OHK0044_12980 [Burkholderiaceae bacterium]
MDRRAYTGLRGACGRRRGFAKHRFALAQPAAPASAAVERGSALLPTARLAVFSFLAPLFGVAFGALILDERLSASFAFAAALVGAGIALVNLRRV